MPKRAPTDHHLRQRRRIIETTRTMAADRGFAAISLSDIAGGADMSAPALYSYFPSRADLLVEVLQGTLDTLIADIDTTDDPSRSSIDRLRTRFDRWSQHVSEGPTAEVALLHWAILDAETDPALETAVREGSNAIRGWFQTLLAAGVETGELRADLDIDTVADLVNACFLGIQMADRHGVTRASTDAMFETLLAMLTGHVTERST